MGGGGDIIVPGPTAEETALLVEQTNILREQGSILREQVRVQNLLSPFLFESAGVEAVLDESGNIISFSPIEDPNKALRTEIETGFLERTQAALKGELPVNPALLKDLAQQEEDLDARLFRDLGPGFATSTPGIESLSEFATFRENILESARRGDLTLSEQLGITRERSNEARIDDTIARLLGINQATLPGASGFGGVAQGFGQAQVPFQQTRQLQTSASIANAQQGNFFGDLFGVAVGQATGFGFGKLFGAFG